MDRLCSAPTVAPASSAACMAESPDSPAPTTTTSIGVLFVELGDLGRLLQKARAHVGRAVLGRLQRPCSPSSAGERSPPARRAPAAVMAARPPNLNRSRRETFIPLVMMGPFPSLVTPSFSESSVAASVLRWFAEKLFASPPQLPRCTTHYGRPGKSTHRPSGKKKFKALNPPINLYVDLGKQKASEIAPARFKP